MVQGCGTVTSTKSVLVLLVALDPTKTKSLLVLLVVRDPTKTKSLLVLLVVLDHLPIVQNASNRMQRTNGYCQNGYCHNGSLANELILNLFMRHYSFNAFGTEHCIF